MKITNQKVVHVDSADIADIIVRIMQEDSEEFHEAFEQGWDAIDAFADALRESERVFTVRTTTFDLRADEEEE